MSEYVPRICESCRERFLARTRTARQPGRRGRFCSYDCAYRARSAAMQGKPQPGRRKRQDSNANPNPVTRQACSAGQEEPSHGPTHERMD